jgi:CHAD domain-containing protein
MTTMLEPIAFPEAPERTRLSAVSTEVSQYLNTQIDKILDGDAGLRRGEDPIHDTRVAIRRLRSTLRVFGSLFDPAAANSAEDDLKWFAGLLGEVRDCQVQAHRFYSAVDTLPDTLVLGPVRARIRDELRAVELPARERVSEAMKSPRYLSMLADLRRWRIDPPLTRSLKATELDKLAKRAYKKADRRLTTALKSSDDALLHRARKAAKRARYAAELLKPSAASTSAKRKVKQYKKIQTVLGDHQDTAVATGVLRQMGAAAGTTVGENGFTFGLLYAREQQIARDSRAAAARLR